MANGVNLTPDANGKFIQALSPDTSNTTSVAIDASSVQLTLPSNTEVIRCAADADCFILFGTDPTATDEAMLFPSGVEVFRVPNGATKIAVIQSGSSTGTFNVTKLV